MTYKESIQTSINVKERLMKDDVALSAYEHIAVELKEVYRTGHKLMVAGNGGSAADAQHFVAEITCQYQKRRGGRPAIALTSNTSELTAWGNDHSFDTIFSRLVEAHGVAGDALVVISTSGNSENLIQATKMAKKNGIKVFGLLGNDGGTIALQCDRAVIVPSKETPRIQECHITLIHSICAELDEFFVQEDRHTAEDIGR